MVTKESKKIPLWDRVFRDLNIATSDKYKLGEETILVYEGETDQYFTEVSVVGIFRLEDGVHMAIVFDYDQKSNHINDVLYEVEIDIHKLKLVAVKAKDFLESLK